MQLPTLVVILMSGSSVAASGQHLAAAYVSESPFTERRPWVAPGRLCALDLPPGWNVHTNGRDPQTFELHPADVTVDAALSVRRLRVPRGAQPRQLLLHALEQRLRELPSFREGPRRDTTVAGHPAAAVAGVYYYQGNAQYPRAVEELIVVGGDEAYVFHFECFEPLAPALAAVVEGVYRSFAIRPPGKGAGVAPPAAVVGEVPVDIDRIPY